jgi:hypothetical protein
MKTAAADVAARNFAFRDVGLPDVLVSESVHDPRFSWFTSTFCTGMHAALGSALSFKFGSPHHHNTTSKSKVRERINGVIAEVLRSFANERVDRARAAHRLGVRHRSSSASPATQLSTPSAASTLATPAASRSLTAP